MSDNYTKYLEALRECRRRQKAWRDVFDLRAETEDTLKGMRKFEGELLHKWYKAINKLDKARSKFEEGLE